MEAIAAVAASDQRLAGRRTPRIPKRTHCHTSSDGRKRICGYVEVIALDLLPDFVRYEDLAVGQQELQER